MNAYFTAVRLGAVETLPLQLGVAPFGLIFGTLAAPAGLDPWAALMMSLLVYAGASQFIALSLLAVGAAIPVIIFSTLIINLRHALYAATLQAPFSPLPFWRRALLAYFLTDETYAIVQRAASRKIVPLDGVMFGSGLVNCSTWLISSALGIALGQSIPDVQHWGLEFAMVASFTGIVIPLLISRAQCIAAGVSAVVALASHHFPYKLGLLLAVFCGVAAAIVVEERKQ